MKNLFRKIRKNFLFEGKFGNYFKYALGEIILVVIGILIALQINNWNEKTKNKTIEIEYLKGIKSNISEDIEELNNLFVGDTAKLDALTFLTNTILKNNVKENENAIIENTYITFEETWFEGQNVVFQNILSSGHLNLIESENIRYLIQKYYQNFDETIKQESIHNEQIRMYLDRYAKLLNTSASFLEPSFEKRWSANVSNPDISALYGNEFETLQSSIIENYSLRKTFHIANHKVRVKLHHHAISLKKEINRYLEEDNN